jgi:thermolabile hemolysin
MLKRTLAIWPFLASVSAADTFDRIVSFGDSLTDTGNVSNLTFGFAPGSNYFNGRFSNGSVWVEQLATQLGVAAPTPSRTGGRNYAHGGVKTGTGTTNLALFVNAPNAGTQVSQFLSANPVRPTDLYVLWAGGNDFLDGQTDVSVPVNNLAASISSLINAGAKHVVIPNLPPLGETPRFNATSNRSVMNTRTSSFNAALATRVSQIQLTTSTNLFLFDVASTFQSILAMPASFGFTNVQARALNGSTVVANPDQYLFFDDVHPTRVGHSLLGNGAFELVTDRRWTGQAGNADWNAPGNWQRGLTPDRVANVTLPSSAPANITLSTDTTLRRLTVEPGFQLNLQQGVDLFVSQGTTVAGIASGDGAIVGGATMAIQLSSQPASVNVVGPATLAGTMSIDAALSFVPLPGDVFEIMQFQSLTGLPVIENATEFAGLWFEPVVDADSLSVIASARPGDANLDAAVDFADLLTLVQNYESTAQTWLAGDFNHDTLVDFQDLLQLAQNYDSAIFRQDWAIARAFVPEPTTTACMTLAAVAIVGRNRTRSFTSDTRRGVSGTSSTPCE